MSKIALSATVADGHEAVREEFAAVLAGDGESGAQRAARTTPAGEQINAAL